MKGIQSFQSQLTHAIARVQDSAEKSPTVIAYYEDDIPLIERLRNNGCFSWRTGFIINNLNYATSLIREGRKNIGREEGTVERSRRG